jgi:hypothetical protein
VLEITEDVLEEVQRDGLGLGDAIALDDVAGRGGVGVRRGELDRGAHRVVNLGRDAHRVAP